MKVSKKTPDRFLKPHIFSRPIRIIMKILAIHGSPRTMQSSTRKLASFVLAGAAEAGAETEIVDLADLRIVPCTACDACAINGICVNDDDVAGLVARMKEADAVVFGSPVYIDNVSGQMKVFFDRLADAIHYQQLAGKYGCSVATTAESGGDDVVAYQNHVLNYLGAVAVGGIRVALGAKPSALAEAEPAARALGKKLAAAVRDGYRDPAQEAAIADNRSYFAAIVRENQDFRPEEYGRWEKAGWL
ncbi:MAG: flavodoxin family protein [Methanoregula sp.]